MMVSKPDTAELSAPRSFYLWLSLWMWAIAITGFGPGAVSGLLGGTFVDSLAVHVHAVVYIAWLALFSYQASLPARGRVDLHRKLGRCMAAYAVVMIAVGLHVTFSRFADRVAAGDVEMARTMMLPPFSDMFVFPVLFWLAYRFRHRPETHKRLMVVATTFLLVAAVGRMSFLGAPPAVLIYDAVWLSPIWIAMLRDAIVERRLHPAYGFSLLLLSFMPLRMLIVDTEGWRGFTDWLAQAVVG
ncbi:MAG: hypothetical protein GWM88_00710 [Pseudomonadales bacterium]|nr:hypothetical protein [Pseudomonadales bacterium]NIX06611.1 hypothetical protein [Pseudomonadales bacterium]